MKFPQAAVQLEKKTTGVCGNVAVNLVPNSKLTDKPVVL